MQCNQCDRAFSIVMALKKHKKILASGSSRDAIMNVGAYILGWSEKHKSWKMQKARADSKSRHTTDFRTVFEIMIGRFVSCEIGQTYFTESGVRFGTLERPDFRSFS